MSPRMSSRRVSMQSRTLASTESGRPGTHLHARILLFFLQCQNGSRTQPQAPANQTCLPSPSSTPYRQGAAGHSATATYAAFISLHSVRLSLGHQNAPAGSALQSVLASQSSSANRRSNSNERASSSRARPTGAALRFALQYSATSSKDRSTGD